MEQAKEQAAPATFPCPGCGGPMSFDSESQALKCSYCGGEQPIRESGVKPVEHDLEQVLDDDAEEGDDLDFGSGEEDAALTDWGVAQQTVHCESCGGETIIPALQTATSCVFCGSPKVLSQGDRASLRPETMIPFQISEDEAAASFKKWKKKRWFVPNAFKKGDIRSKLTAIYLPYWTYDAQTDSDYTAERGVYHYRTVTKTRTVDGKTETYTEQERYTVWTRVWGEYDRWFDDILVPASGRYDAELLEKLGDFDLERLTGYKPEYLSGYIAERYSIDRVQGWERARQRIRETLSEEICAKIGGDEIRGLGISTDYSERTYKHLLLPVWNANYKYKNKPFRYMVNGQTGTVSGHVPRSAVKITFFTLFCLALAAFVYYLYVQYGGE